MENVWLQSALWIGLALAASIISIRVAMSVALIEIMVGAVAGNIVGLQITDWVNFLAGFGAILLTFLAGTEIDRGVLRKQLGPSVGIGVVSFLAPYLGCMAYARYVLGWSWPQAQIAGISLSTTSVAVVYAVMIETGYNKTELGKIILAACFITDLGRSARLPPPRSGSCRASRRGSSPGLAIASASRKPSSSRSCCSGLAVSRALPAARPCCPPTSSAWRWRPRSSAIPSCRTACASSPSPS